MPPAPPDRRAANLLGALAVAVTDALRADLAGLLGRGESAAAALLTVGHRPGQSIDELRRTIGKEHSSVVRLVRSLEDDGLVERDADPSDLRTVRLRLTPAGAATFRKALERREAVLGHRLARLTPTQRRHLGALLVRLLEEEAPGPEEARTVCRMCDHRICRGTDCPVGGRFVAAS